MLTKLPDTVLIELIRLLPCEDRLALTRVCSTLRLKRNSFWQDKSLECIDHCPIYRSHGYDVMNLRKTLSCSIPTFALHYGQSYWLKNNFRSGQFIFNHYSQYMKTMKIILESLYDENSYNFRCENLRDLFVVCHFTGFKQKLEKEPILSEFLNEKTTLHLTLIRDIHDQVSLLKGFTKNLVSFCYIDFNQRVPELVQLLSSCENLSVLTINIIQDNLNNLINIKSLKTLILVNNDTTTIFSSTIYLKIDWSKIYYHFSRGLDVHIVIKERSFSRDILPNIPLKSLMLDSLCNQINARDYIYISRLYQDYLQTFVHVGFRWSYQALMGDYENGLIELVENCHNLRKIVFGLHFEMGLLEPIAKGLRKHSKKPMFIVDRQKCHSKLEKEPTEKDLIDIESFISDLFSYRWKLTPEKNFYYEASKAIGFVLPNV